MTEPLPAWGELLRTRREQAGLTIREAARKAGLSDSFWGQAEKGYQSRSAGRRHFTPSIGSLLHMCRTLRLSDPDTDEVIVAAGYPPLPARRADKPVRWDVDTSGLTREDLRLLNGMADRLRRGPVGPPT